MVMTFIHWNWKTQKMCTEIDKNKTSGKRTIAAVVVKHEREQMEYDFVQVSSCNNFHSIVAHNLLSGWKFNGEFHWKYYSMIFHSIYCFFKRRTKIRKWRVAHTTLRRKNTVIQSGCMYDLVS